MNPSRSLWLTGAISGTDQLRQAGHRQAIPAGRVAPPVAFAECSLAWVFVLPGDLQAPQQHALGQRMAHP